METMGSTLYWLDGGDAAENLNLRQRTGLIIRLFWFIIIYLLYRVNGVKQATSKVSPLKLFSSPVVLQYELIGIPTMARENGRFNVISLLCGHSISASLSPYG